MMSAIVVCGSKRSFFEDIPTTSTPISSKRIRCSSSSPIRFSPPFSSSLSPSDQDHHSIDSAAIDHLRSIFPDMDKELLERALEECGNDLDSAIKSLNELRLESVERTLVSDAKKYEQSSQDSAGIATTSGDPAPSNNLLASDNLPTGGSEWVELLVREMVNSSNMDDAKARASRVLEVLEKSIRVSAGAEAAQSFQMENIILKKRVEELICENAIFKRTVVAQHTKSKEYDDRNHELQRLKQLVSQYQEQLRTLEVNNYALSMHLRQAQQSSSIPGRFHPDIF